MQVTIPFGPNDKILEVGGGDIPSFRPNLDMRKLPTVDYVCNLEETWPIDDESFDGVFGKFVIEHMSWRKIPDFAAECYRVLKPGGAAIMVAPNTLAQCQEIAKIGDIGTKESSMIFGGQEEPGWNEHKAAFSPNFAVKLFRMVGFDRVIIKTWPGQIWTGARTDMIIEAYKAIDAPHVKGSLDAWIRKQIKAADSILDFCGDNDRWDERGYNVAITTNLNYPDKSYDDVIAKLDGDNLARAVNIAKKRVVVYSESLLELDKELDKTGYAASKEKISVQRDFRGKKANEEEIWEGAVIDLSQPKPQEWYQKLDDDLQKTVGITNKKIGLVVGSFTVMSKTSQETNWINCDILDLNAYAQQNGFIFKQFDARQGLPWPDSSIDFIVASHFMEHISRLDGDKFLQECLRVLRKDGTIRITVPNTMQIAKTYVNGSICQCFDFNEGVKSAKDDSEAFWNLLTAGHVTAYDDKSMANKLAENGFSEVAKMEYGNSRSREIQSGSRDMYPELSCYIEGVKAISLEKAPIGLKSDPSVPKQHLIKEPYAKYLDGEISEGKQ